MPPANWWNICRKPSPLPVERWRKVEGGIKSRNICAHSHIFQYSYVVATIRSKTHSKLSLEVSQDKENTAFSGKSAPTRLASRIYLLLFIELIPERVAFVFTTLLRFSTVELTFLWFGSKWYNGLPVISQHLEKVYARVRYRNYCPQFCIIGQNLYFVPSCSAPRLQYCRKNLQWEFTFRSFTAF